MRDSWGQITVKRGKITSSPQNLSCVAVVNLLGTQRQSQGQSSNASCFTRTEVDQSLLLFLCFCFMISCCSCLFLALLPISEGYLLIYLSIIYLLFNCWTNGPKRLFQPKQFCDFMISPCCTKVSCKEQMRLQDAWIYSGSQVFLTSAPWIGKPRVSDFFLFLSAGITGRNGCLRSTLRKNLGT